MGNILSPLTTASSLSGLFGSSYGSNTPDYSSAEKVTGFTGAGATLASQLGGASLVGLLGAMLSEVTLGLSAVLLIVSKLFHGADPLQVPASQVEQAFEAAADDFRGLARGAPVYPAGVIGPYPYLTKAEATAAIQRITQIGVQYFQNLLQTLPAAQSDPKPFRDGLAHMQQINEAEEVFPASFPNRAALAWNPSAAAKMLIQNGTAGWYSKPGESIDAATALVMAYMTALRGASQASASQATATNPAVSSGLASPSSSTVVATASKSSLSKWLLGIGVLGLAVKLL